MEEERRQREKLLNCKVPEEGRRLTKNEIMEIKKQRNEMKENIMKGKITKDVTVLFIRVIYSHPLLRNNVCKSPSNRIYGSR